MNVTVVGTGEMGSALVTLLAPRHRVTWVGRTAESAAAKVASLPSHLPVQAADVHDALRADVIILALWHRDMVPFVQRHADALQGQVVVDIANPFTEDFEDFFTPFETSAAEILQAAIPESTVVGAFKNTFAAVFTQPDFTEGASDVLITSNDEAARQLVMELLAHVPFRVLDAGMLSNNRTIERMTLLSREVGRRHGFTKRLAYRMLGQP